MKKFRDLSIRSKLVLINLLISTTALLVASAGILVYDTIAFRKEMVQNLSILANVIGTSSAAALSFQDPVSAAETLSALKVKRHITAAFVYDSQGNVFSQYRRSDQESKISPPAANHDTHYFRDDSLHLFQSIVFHGEKIGTVYIQSDLSEQTSRLARYVGIMAAVLLASLVVALMLSSRLERIISGPILHLVQLESRVSKERNYSLRAVKERGDELGLLVDNFNEMLSQIQQRDAELTVAKEYADSLIGNMIDTLVVIDSQGIITKTNKATLDLLAYTEEEVIGLPMGKLLEDEEIFQMLRGLIEAGSVHEFELTYVSKHGRKIAMSCTGSVVRDRDGEIQGIVCTAKDITEQKHAEEALRESEERFRTLFENIPIGVYRSTPEGRFVNANPAMVRMLGFDSLEELMEWDLQKELYELGFSRLEFRKRIETKEEIKGFEASWKRKDGTMIFVRENAKVIRDSNGVPIYYEGTVEDITERKKIEQMKNEFISIVSHELRVPMTSIRGALEWMAQNLSSELPERAKKLLAIAGRSTERMVRLVNDMLDIDKIESGKMAFYIKPLEITALVEHAIEANQPYAEQLGVKLILERSLPEAKVKGDGDRLVQVMTNLLSNAAKFSPTNDQVGVSILRQDSSIRVAITDHGPGIPEKFRSRIFQKFAQVQTSDPRQKGTGLGLSISKAIVEKLGGRIGFEIDSATGTTFYFELPEYHE